jgi:hypothetical protein
MPLPIEVFNDMLVSTMQNYQEETVDNFTNNVPLLKYFKKNMRTFSGGTFLTKHIEYSENLNVKAYNGLEVLGTGQNNILTNAFYEVKQYSVPVIFSGRDKALNSSKEQLIDLLDTRVSNAYSSLTNRLGADIYLDGSGDGGRSIGGLALLVSSTPNVGIVGGIDRSSSVGAFWRNQVFSGVVNGGAAITATNILQYVNRILSNTKRNANKVKVIVLGSNYYALMQDALNTQGRYMINGDKLDGGFADFTYQGIPVLDGGGVGATMDANIGYFLNTDFITMESHKEQNFAPLPFGDRPSGNQDAMLRYVGWYGNMTLTNSKLQAVLVP